METAPQPDILTARFSAADAREYRRRQWWTDLTLGELVGHHADHRSESTAFSDGTHRLRWRELHHAVEALVEQLLDSGVAPGQRVAVYLDDSVEQHVCYLALERVGAVVVGIGAKAGSRELAQLLSRTGAQHLITGVLTDSQSDALDGIGRAGIELAQHILSYGPDGISLTSTGLRPNRTRPTPTPLGADDLFWINSTSGTTGLPKAVLHTQNRWHYFHTHAARNGDLSSDDVLLAAIPGPFGFGIWTSHVTPIHLGAHVVLLKKFSVIDTLRAIERERVTVLCCVSSQLVMMLADPRLYDHDLSSLRVVFTGGEAVPYSAAAEFEDVTGARILQFYGSNETGLLSGTNLSDPREKRLRTAGKVVAEMQVRLFDGDRDVTEQGVGQPACKGPALSLGYLDDEVGNASLYTDDGWMRMGDICRVDEDGYLSVVGRISDFAIRGGKNIPLTVVENDVLSHPAVAGVAAVPMPDPILGERVCVFVEPHPDAHLTLAEVTSHLTGLGVSRELHPERLVLVGQLPRSSGGKIAKGELKDEIARIVHSEAVVDTPVAPAEGDFHG